MTALRQASTARSCLHESATSEVVAPPTTIMPGHSIATSRRASDSIGVAETASPPENDSIAAARISSGTSHRRIVIARRPRGAVTFALGGFEGCKRETTHTHDYR